MKQHHDPQAKADRPIVGNIESIPQELQGCDQWVCWRFKKRGGKLTKVPYDAGSGGSASSTDPGTWTSFKKAMAASGQYDGVGFVFTEGDSYFGIDLDDCLTATGDAVPEAAAIIKQINSYTEISPSRRGVKIFAKGSLPNGVHGRRTKKVKGFKEIEIYDAGHYFTVTGQHFPSTPTTIEKRHEQLQDLYDRFWEKPKKQPARGSAITPGGAPPLPPDRMTEVLNKALASKTGAKIRPLFDGDLSAHGGDHSAADLSLCAHLAFFCGPNPALIDQLFRRSRLMRPKWDDRHSGNGLTYGQMTIAKALNGRTEFYEWPGSGQRPQVQDESWDEPVPLRVKRDLPPFPMENGFPSTLGQIRDFVATLAESVQVPVDLPAMLLPAIVCLCIAKKFEIRTAADHTEVPAIWTVTLLESGNRKSSTHSRMLHPIHEWEAEENNRMEPLIAEQQENRKIDEEKLKAFRRRASKPGAKDAKGVRHQATALAQKLAKEKLDTVPQLVTTEPTTEAVGKLLVNNNERLLVASSEADGIDVLLGRYAHGVPNFGVYLAGYSGDPYRCDRRGRPPDHLTRPVLSMALTVQPDAVIALLQNRQARGRGFLARFMFSIPTSLLGRRKIHPVPVPKQLEMTYSKALRRLLDIPINEQPQILIMSKGAQKLFDGFAARIEPMLGKGGGLADRAEWAGKLCGTIGRIAMALHVLDVWGVNHVNSAHCAHSTLEISVDTMRAALAWAPYLIDQERAVGEVVGPDVDTMNAERVLTWSRQEEHQEFKFRDAFSACRSQRAGTVEIFRPAVDLLEKHGYVRPLDPPPRTGAGRAPSSRYAVNPLWVANPERSSG